MFTFSGPKQFHNVFSATLHRPSTVQGQFTAAVGHALSSTKEAHSAAALNHMSYLQCTVKSIDLHKLKTNLYEYVREYSSSHVTWKCHNPK
jgi:hypothetical protein